MTKNAVFCLVLALVSLNACSRSQQYRRDEEYPRADQNPSYYDQGKTGGPKMGAAKFEGMGQPKKRVVIVDFYNNSPVKVPQLGAFSADELRRGLHISGRLIVPTDIKSDYTSEDFVQGDRVKVAQLIREGRRLGVAVLVIGRLTKIIFRQQGEEIGVLRQKQSLAAVDVEIKVFDVGGGREIMAAAKTGESNTNTMVALEEENTNTPDYKAEVIRLATRDAMNKLVPDVLKAVEKMTWTGRVAKVSGSRIYVNAGRASGLVIGDILKVLTPGDDVFDPATGAFLGRSQGQLKGTLEVMDFLGPDGAVSEIHTGGNFQEGDVVQLY